MILDNLGTTIAKKRADAISARQACGIEDDWVGDEEFYQGYDDANRHEYVRIESKPNEGGQSSDKRTAGTDIRSTVFPNITQPYVDAASARVADMLLPTDDRNFVFEPTPIAQLVFGMPEAPQQPEQAPVIGMVQPPAAPGAMGAPAGVGAGIPAMPGTPPGAQPGTTAPAEDSEDELPQAGPAREAAKKAQRRVDDWLTEAGWHDEMRKIIDECAKLGSGSAFGPMPKLAKKRRWILNGKTGLRELHEESDAQPFSRQVSVWDVFPDYPACGENIHNGSFILVRDRITQHQLTELMEQKGPGAYLKHQIKAVLEEGPDKRNTPDARSRLRGFDTDSKTQFEIWYWFGHLTAKELTAAGCNCGTDPDEKTWPALVVMVNDRVIKATKAPLDGGTFPVDIVVWKRRPGMPWGVGIARQGRTPQRIVVAATRAMMDNAGASAKPHKVISADIEQAGDPWTWRASGDGPVNMGQAMVFFTQPSYQAEFMGIIQMGEKMMETVTGMPAILMGLQGDIEETAKGRTIQNNNGNSVLRRIARSFDANLIVPHIKRYYDWIMQHGEDESEKGDFTIKARGSSALVERDIQSQNVLSVLQAALDPRYKMSPKKARDEWLKSIRFDPKAFDMTPEEITEAQNNTPPPPPQVQAAQIREQGQTQRTQMELQAEAAEREKDRALEKELVRLEKMIEAELSGAELTQGTKNTLDKIKADLAKVTMTLKTQVALATGKAAPELANPAAEPPGQAPAGQAFQR